MRSAAGQGGGYIATPYITPNIISNAPTGISWSIIPFPKASTADQLAEQQNICWRATTIVDGYCNQALRATVDNEQRSGPGDFRINLEQGTGNIRWVLSRWPVTEVLAVQISPNGTFPRQWNQVPPTMTDIENPVIGVYGSNVPSGSGGAGGQSILIAPGFAGWTLGRNGFRFACSYVNGWPHSGLMSDATAGATTLTVDNVTGFTGAAAFIYDGSSTEVINVLSVTATNPTVLPNGGGTAPAGPGTLQLAEPLMFGHNGGNPATVLVSSLPADVIWAATLAATTQALDAGITSVSIQNLPGSQTVGGHGTEDLMDQYKELLKPYKRVI
jgi:hypothetical protein